MISMTGYGRGTCDVFGRRLLVEIRSVNHRFFDLKLRLPWMDSAIEALLLSGIRKRVERGALTVTVRDDASAVTPQVRVNLPLARSYHAALKELAKELGMDEKAIPIEVVMQLRDVIIVGEPERSADELFEALRPGLERGLDALLEMRKREGEALGKDLLAHATKLTALTKEMETIARDAPQIYRKRLEERLQRVLGPGEVDPQRLAQEVAVFADRADVAEELVRLASHLGQFNTLCEDPGPVGRRLDFLLQEMNREVNTIGSKAQSAPFARLIVDAKAELEKMREQVQNVE